jgi:peptidoglycan/xylan/chitin deacetylase (PgdA/CDA1 family)
MILLYHGVVPDESPPARTCVGQALRQSDFKRQIQWLAKRHPIVSLSEYIAGFQEHETGNHRPIAISFDDGYSHTFDCVYPILAEMNIPSAIFITTGHLDHGELLWFSYIKALCFEGLYPVVQAARHSYPLRTLKQRKRSWVALRELAIASGDPILFCKTLSQTCPLDTGVVDFYGGMTAQQIKLASEMDLIEIGAHTVTHPILTRLPIQAQRSEIQGSRQVLSALAGKPVRYFAYPGGKYDRDSVDLVKAAGYEAAFAVIPQGKMDPRFEISRTGVYSASLLKLHLKTLGLAYLGRRLGLKTG